MTKLSMEAQRGAIVGLLKTGGAMTRPEIQKALAGKMSRGTVDNRVKEMVAERGLAKAEGEDGVDRYGLRDDPAMLALQAKATVIGAELDAAQAEAKAGTVGVAGVSMGIDAVMRSAKMDALAMYRARLQAELAQVEAQIGELAA